MAWMPPSPSAVGLLSPRLLRELPFSPSQFGQVQAMRRNRVKPDFVLATRPWRPPPPPEEARADDVTVVVVHEAAARLPEAPPPPGGAVASCTTCHLLGSVGSCWRAWVVPGGRPAIVSGCCWPTPLLL
jgi:hypothetical protein